MTNRRQRHATNADLARASVSTYLQRLKKERGLTLMQMAQAAYAAFAEGKTPTLVRQGALYSYVYGNSAPTRAALMAVAATFDVPPEDICDPALLQEGIGRPTESRPRANLEMPKVQIRRSKYGLEVVRLVVDAYLPAKVGDAMATLLQEKLKQAVRLHNLKE